MGFAQTPIDAYEDDCNPNIIRDTFSDNRIYSNPFENESAQILTAAGSVENNQNIESCPENENRCSDDTDLEEEMMQIKPTHLSWTRCLIKGDLVDAQNVFGIWCRARVSNVRNREIFVDFLNMNNFWSRWIPLDSSLIAVAGMHSSANNRPVLIDQSVEVRQSCREWSRNSQVAFNDHNWKEAIVKRFNDHGVYVQYIDDQSTEWIPFEPTKIAPIGQHLYHRRLSQGRLSKVEPTAPRHRMIQAQNPRFLHYQTALMRDGLSVYAVKGDGNCLFRSVSHQIYGDDGHHALIRSYCVDYMESEKEYFEPYVVGGMSEYLIYLQHKRRDGVWGDDPEIQAMCELYDRPAEVFAYDSDRGYRKLRTFHESSTLTRNRPSIRLSYYGSGHYDSIVGLDYSANLIREDPGVWERIHLDYSRHIVDRRQTSAAEVDDSISYHLAESDRECTEVEQLQHILQLSRNEFDAMNSSLDDTLKHFLRDGDGSTQSVHDTDGVKQVKEITADNDIVLDTVKADSEEAVLQRVLQKSLEESFSKAPVPTDGVQGTLSQKSIHDKEFEAAMQASLVDYKSSNLGQEESASTNLCNKIATSCYNDHIELALELSVKEYDAERAALLAAAPNSSVDPEVLTNMDELDELQRAIQASLSGSNS